MNIRQQIVLRVRLAFLLVLLFSVAIVWKISHIQFVQGEKWIKMAEEIHLQYMKVPATRGNILSDNGSLLATSLPFFKVAFDPRVVEREAFKNGIDSLSWLLARFYKDRTPSEYKRKILDARADGKRFLVLNHKMISYQEMKMMRNWPIFREGRLKGGAIFEKVDKRFKPFSALALRTIGFVNEQRQGAGLEYSFNQQLAGTDGEALFRKMAGGAWKPLHDENEVTPEQGLDIQTTIDVNIQDVAEASLEKHLRQHGADYGCVVLMEVATGEIKAMANLGLDPKSGQYIENYNYAVGNQGLTEPGSTFKLASLMALFEDSKLALEDTVHTGNGKYKFYDKVMTDSKPEGYGVLTVKESFEKSSNVAVSKLIQEHFGRQPGTYRNYIRKFGLDKPLGFQMTGEASPYIKNPEDSTWSGVTLPWMSIGYEVKVSPLQILTFYNAIANGGKMISPLIVKAIYKADMQIEEFDSKVLNEKICSDETLEKVKVMLEGVVENGTAKNIKNEHYKIGGKTGTAQKIKDGAYTKTYYTSFVGYFPAQKPKYSCIVVIDNPKGFLQYGSDVSAPVFKEVADKIYSLDVEMQRPIVKDPLAKQGVFPEIKAGHADELRKLCNQLGISNHAQTQEDWVGTSPSNNAVLFSGRQVREGWVPDVTGMTLRDALYILENNGLRVSFQGHGRIVEQSLMPGSRVPKGGTIYLKLS